MIFAVLMDKNVIHLHNGAGEYPFTLCEHMYCNWFDKEADLSIAGQKDIGQESQTRRMLRRKIAESGVTSRGRGKQDGHVILGKCTKAHGQNVDK